MRTRFNWSTVLLLAGIALLKLTADSIGQLPQEDRLFSMHFKDVTYSSEGHIAEHGMVYNIMTAPAEGSYDNQYPYLEPWMVIPFESGLVEENLEVESWMVVPFGIDEEIEIESWMTAAFTVSHSPAPKVK